LEDIAEVREGQESMKNKIFESFKRYALELDMITNMNVDLAVVSSLIPISWSLFYVHILFLNEIRMNKKSQ